LTPEARAIARLAASPATTGISLDFDGTLAEIVSDPAAARPLPGAARVIGALAERFAKVAVVSGRPVAFLVERLDLGAVASPVELYGHYGLEHRLADGSVIEPPEEHRYEEVARAALVEARARAPRGVIVEAKGISLTLHWRQAPEEMEASIALAFELAGQFGLTARQGAMAIELVPDSGQDKGSAVRSIFSDLSTGCVLGDDVGDIPAFLAARELERARDFQAELVVVNSAEVPPELLELATLSVDGPQGALAFLEALTETPD
jgi:trehalose 6-phosphate phosphatase